MKCWLLHVGHCFRLWAERLENLWGKNVCGLVGMGGGGSTVGLDGLGHLFQFQGFHGLRLGSVQQSFCSSSSPAKPTSLYKIVQCKNIRRCFVERGCLLLCNLDGHEDNWFCYPGCEWASGNTHLQVTSVMSPLPIQMELMEHLRGI